MSTDSYEVRDGRKVINLSSNEPERPAMTKRQTRREERAWSNLRSPETGIAGRIAGADYATAKHAEQIMSGAFGKRGKKFETAIGGFIQQHRMHPSTAVSRYMEHGHLSAPSRFERKSGE
jgi:hypothetical protein